MRRIFSVPDSYHELFLEKKIYRDSITSVIIDFFSQNEDTVSSVKPIGPLFEGEITSVLTLPQAVFRATGAIMAVSLGVIGLSMIISGRRNKIL